jgi:hypothetical protein
MDPVHAELLVRAVAVHRRALANAPVARERLARMGVSDAALLDRFAVGWADGSLASMARGETAERLRALGLVDPEGRERFAGCVVIPVFDGKGAVAQIAGYPEEGALRWLFPEETPTFWNAACLKSVRDVLVVPDPLEGLVEAAGGRDVGGGGRRGHFRRRGWGQAEMVGNAKQSSWSNTKDVLFQVEAPRNILWSAECLEGGRTRSGGTAAASPTARPARLRLNYLVTAGMTSLLCCELDGKSIQQEGLGQEVEATGERNDGSRVNPGPVAHRRNWPLFSTLLADCHHQASRFRRAAAGRRPATSWN